MGHPNHPYFPRTLEMPLYVPNKCSVFELLAVFFCVLLVIVLTTWWLTGKKQFLTLGERLVICWFTASGFIHMILEGYFSVFHADLVARGSYLGEMWKEYGNADSRYLTSDTFVWCMETITAFVDGPLCIATSWSLATRGPYRHALTIMTSLCQLYGDVLYFMTEIKENFTHGNMWHPLHFWVYFIFMNLFWIVIPLFLILRTCGILAQVQSRHDRQKKE